MQFVKFAKKPPFFSKLIIIFVLMTVLFSCSRNNDDISLANFIINRTTQPVKMSDLKNNVWKKNHEVFESYIINRTASQFSNIFGMNPQALTDNDIVLSVFMAYDAGFWYIGCEVIDDVICSISPDSPYPFSGDCLEIFFTSRDLNSKKDMSSFIEYPNPNKKNSFFQCIIPAVQLENKANHFSLFRTDKEFIKELTNRGFQVDFQSEGKTWRAIARIPLIPFDTYSKIIGHNLFKMNIDFLDYDTETSIYDREHHWGFTPDNVFCLDREKPSVSVPYYMRKVKFR